MISRWMRAAGALAARDDGADDDVLSDRHAAALDRRGMNLVERQVAAEQ